MSDSPQSSSNCHHEGKTSPELYNTFYKLCVLWFFRREEPPQTEVLITHTSGIQLPAHQLKHMQPFPSANRDLSQCAMQTQPFDSKDYCFQSHYCPQPTQFNFEAQRRWKLTFPSHPKQDWKSRNPLTAGRWSFSSLVLTGSLNTDGTSLMEDIHLQWLY